MILIPSEIKLKLIELDTALQQLGRKLYGRKLFSEYEQTNRFYNFVFELYPDGSFTLHFQRNILGHIDNKYFQAFHGAESQQLQLDELEMTIGLVNNRLELVGA